MVRLINNSVYYDVSYNNSLIFIINKERKWVKK